jgi:lysophospholipase L1-like esterase
MNRSRFALPLLLIVLLAAQASSASARSTSIEPPGTVRIGHVGLGTSPSGLTSILVPVQYPIQLAGRLVETRVRLFDPGHGTVRTWVLHEALSSGSRRKPERRRRFLFVHRIRLAPELARRLHGLRVRVLARAAVDVEGDGTTDLHDVTERVRPLPAAFDNTCSSLPRIKLRPGRRVSVPLPVCGAQVRWSLAERPQQGGARVRHGRLVYSAPGRFRGSDRIHLVARRLGAQASGGTAKALATSDVQVVVGIATSAVVRALGDSVTAGFGYYSNGTPMTIGRLLGCRPPAKEFDDACSSNSLVTANTQKLLYAPDYGLSNNVSWAAQWANEHGVTDYANFAVSGSEPSDWAPKGELHKTTEAIEAEDPDYILMTVGANPLLSNMLFGIDNMGCAISSDILGGYRECIERAFREVHLRENLKALYEDLVAHTSATIYLMQYHLAVPSTALAYSATQIAEMGVLLNGEIASVAAEVNPKRLQVVAPPHFNVGIDISPVYPSAFSCSRLGYTVDGPSVQSNPTQDELEVLHPLSFCEGPEGGGPPWVISGDTGIHPSAAGYAQMAAQVPPPA